jgi:hypothetical protein
VVAEGLPETTSMAHRGCSRRVLKKSHFAMINFMNPQVSDLSFDRKLGFSAASSSYIDGPS